jgi:protein involved in polysaccharide export with SLBB domain
LKVASRALAALGMLAVLSAPGWGQESSIRPGSPTDLSGQVSEPGSEVPSTTAGASRGRAEERPSAIPLPGSVDPDVYHVGPGDVLLLQLWGKVSRTLTLDVGPEGVILLPGAGNVKVDGKTLREVRTSVLAILKEQFHGVSMDLRLARPRTFRVYVTGQVATPGPVLATGSSRVADVLGPTVVLPGASQRRIEITHRDGSREVADLGRFLLTGEAPLNPWLRDGDVVHVPVATQSLSVEGAVARPGTFELGLADSVLTALRLAGNTLPAARMDSALLVRWNGPHSADSVLVDLRDVYARRLNPAVRDGDRLYVYFVPQYHSQEDVALLGEVQRPGRYPIVEGHTRLSDLIAVAGGFRPNADLASIRVHRTSETVRDTDPELDRLLRLSRNDLTGGEYATLRTKLASHRADYQIDWKRLMNDKSQLDLLLRNGDEVRVDRLVLSIRVDGEVKRPGILTYQHGLSVDDYIRQAGGFTERAWKSKTRVARAVTGQTILGKDVHSLDPGDFIWVPDKPETTLGQTTRDALTILALLATVVLGVQSVTK